MKLRDDQLRLQGLLKETITLLCKNGLHFKSGFCVEALIGITTDDSDVFLVNIKESVRSDGADSNESQLDISVSKEDGADESESDERKAKPSRKRPPDGGSHSTPVKRTRSEEDAASDDDNDDDSSTTEHDVANVKREPDEDLVFVKQELTSDYDTPNTSVSQFPGQPSLSQGYSIQDPSFDGSHDGSTSGAAWNQPGNMDPNTMAMASQSQSGSQQIQAQEYTEPGTILCQVCHEVFTDASKLNAHYRFAHTATPGLFVCTLCCQRYTRKDELTYHLRLVHRLGDAVACKWCGRDNFSSRRTYYRHMKDCASKVAQ